MILTDITKWLRSLFTPSEPTKIVKEKKPRCDGWQRHKNNAKRKRRRNR